MVLRSKCERAITEYLYGNRWPKRGIHTLQCTQAIGYVHRDRHILHLLNLHSSARFSRPDHGVAMRSLQYFQNSDCHLAALSGYLLLGLYTGCGKCKLCQRFLPASISSTTLLHRGQLPEKISILCGMTFITVSPIHNYGGNDQRLVEVTRQTELQFSLENPNINR